MSTRNRMIEAVSPIVIEATTEVEAQNVAEQFEEISKEFGGVKLSELSKVGDDYVIQFGFTNLYMYQDYLKKCVGADYYSLLLYFCNILNNNLEKKSLNDII